MINKIKNMMCIDLYTYIECFVISVEQYKSVTPKTVTESKAPPGMSTNPLDNLNCMYIY